VSLVYSGVRRLAELLRLDHLARRERLLMLFLPYNAYMDESGTHDESEVVALAGYLTTYDGWNDFEDEWNQVMCHYRVNDFHMTDFVGHREEFDDNNYWTPEIRTHLIERVTGICQQKTTIGVGCAIIKEQYERLLSPKIREDLKHPYYFCLYACLNMLINWGDQRLATIKPIQFLFDQKPGRFRLGSLKVRWQTWATDFFHTIKDGLDENGLIVGGITFGSRQDYPQLRAADLLVYEVARLRLNLWKEPERDIRRSMEVLKKDMNLMVSFPDEKEIRNFGRIIEMAAEASAKGMNDQEIWAELRKEFPKS